MTGLCLPAAAIHNVGGFITPPAFLHLSFTIILGLELCSFSFEEGFRIIKVGVAKGSLRGRIQTKI